jgi:hypothetical protein
MAKTWQERREAQVQSSTIAEVVQEPDIWCACMGPQDGEPLCPCRMRLWYQDRTRRFVCAPIINLLRNKSSSAEGAAITTK